MSFRQLSFEEWLNDGSPAPEVISSAFVKYSWSEDVYAVHFFGKERKSWLWKKVSFEDWKRAGFPQPSIAGWIEGTNYYKSSTSDDIIATLNGLQHKLTFQEWADAGYPKPIIEYGTGINSWSRMDPPFKQPSPSVRVHVSSTRNKLVETQSYWNNAMYIWNSAQDSIKFSFSGSRGAGILDMTDAYEVAGWVGVAGQYGGKLNAYYYDKPDFGSLYIEAAAAHELGHSLGLHHVRNSSSLMYENLEFYKKHGVTSPGAGELLGVQAIYGKDNF